MKKFGFSKKIFSSAIIMLFIFVQMFSIIPLKVKAEESFTVEVVVVGNQGVIAQGTSNKKNAKEAVDEVLGKQSPVIPMTVEKGMISKIGSIQNEGWNKYWYTAINRNNKYASVDYGIEQLELQNKDRFLVYYTDPMALTASKILYSTNLPNQKLVITLNSLDYRGVANPITGISVKVDGNPVTLNNIGQVVIENGLPQGNHTLEVSDYKSNPAEIPSILADKFTFTLDLSGASNNNGSGEIYDRDNRAVVKNIDSEIANTYPSLSKSTDLWATITLEKLGVKSNEELIKSYNEDILKYGIKDYSNTDLEKIILALTAAGFSPYEFAGQDLVSELYNRNIDDFIVNDTIFALLTYNYCNITGNYKITKDKLVQQLMSKKLAYQVNWVDRLGWALSGNAANPDITAMAINALAPYYNTNTDVKKAVDTAVLTLSSMENESGYIVFFNGTANEVTSESISTVILALTSLGINPEGAQFANPKGDLVSALLSFKGADGQFKHTLDGSNDKIATEQALRALIALKEFKNNGKYNFYTSNIDTSKLTVYSANVETQSTSGNGNKEVLPQTGGFLDTNTTVIAGILFIIMGLGMAFINKRKILNK